MKDVTFIKSISVLHVENYVPMPFFSSPRTPRKLIKHMTSDFDVREVELSKHCAMKKQLSVLPAKPSKYSLTCNNSFKQLALNKEQKD